MVIFVIDWVSRDFSCAVSFCDSCVVIVKDLFQSTFPTNFSVLPCERLQVSVIRERGEKPSAIVAQNNTIKPCPNAGKLIYGLAYRIRSCIESGELNRK